MQSMSTAYNTQIKQKIRNPSYIKILFRVTDPEAINDSSVSDNGNMYWSDTSNITGIQEVTDTYMTLEYNRTVLDGNCKLPIIDGEPQTYQGFCGDIVSDENGNWAVNPTVTINFLTSYFQFAGLVIMFDSIMKNYPTEFNINVYKENVLVQSINCNPTNSELTINEPIVECDRIEFEAVKSNVPYRRFRIENITLGLRRTFSDSDITSAEWKREVDFVNSKLPTNDFNFKIIDKEREYDPENPTGIYSYMESQQECNIQLGYELNSGDVEWMPVGKLFTTGDLKIDTEATIPVVEFKTQSTLAFLINNYKKGKYYPTGRTLFDLATDVLMDANLPLDEDGQVRWVLDDTLKNYTTLVPLSNEKMNVLLQQIANAGMCVLDIDRAGYITIKPKHNTLQSFGYTLGDLMSPPAASKYPVLQGVDTSYQTVVIGDSEQIGQYDIEGASSTVYELSYDMATDVSASAGSGLTIVGTPIYYAQTCQITLTGTGTLTINGKKITINKVDVSLEYNNTGERCPITNPLINNKTHSLEYAQWVGDYINRRIMYEFDDRGFPEVDCGDSITFNTLYTENLEVDVLATTIKFNGAISGTTKVLKK